MKTAKITKVVSKKDFTNSYGTTIYHQLQMDNGDKIEIGKKKEQKVGYELTYEIVDEQSGEYKQSKSVQPQQPNQTASYTPNTVQSNPSGLNVQNLIVAQSSLSTAAELYKGEIINTREILDTAEIFYKWVLQMGIN